MEQETKQNERFPLYVNLLIAVIILVIGALFQYWLLSKSSDYILLNAVEEITRLVGVVGENKVSDIYNYWIVNPRNVLFVIPSILVGGLVAMPLFFNTKESKSKKKARLVTGAWMIGFCIIGAVHAFSQLFVWIGYEFLFNVRIFILSIIGLLLSISFWLLTREKCGVVQFFPIMIICGLGIWEVMFFEKNQLAQHVQSLTLIGYREVSFSYKARTFITLNQKELALLTGSKNSRYYGKEFFEIKNDSSSGAACVMVLQDTIFVRNDIQGTKLEKIIEQEKEKKFYRVL